MKLILRNKFLMCVTGLTYNNDASQWMRGPILQQLVHRPRTNVPRYK